MAKINNKKYTIRLTHPKFGSYYYNYKNSDYYGNDTVYTFTQNLSKVTTWKTINCIEKEVLEISSILGANRGKIVLSLGSDVSDEIKNDTIFCSRKRYYHPIFNVKSEILINNAKKTIDRLDSTLKMDSKNITKLIKKNKHLDENFIDILNNLVKDSTLYKKEHNFLEKVKTYDDVYIDIVDASYGFRLLKLKTLKKIQNDEHFEIK